MNNRQNIFRKIMRELLLKWRCKARYDLERKMFPKIKNKKVLFVGVASYTKDYPEKLERNDLWTIDVNPEVAQFGARKHIVGSIVNVGKYFPKDFFDYIFFCGVFGFGVDTIKDAEKVMKNCYKVLKKKGILILGWDSYYSPIIPDELKNFKLFKAVPHFGFPIRYTSSKEKKTSDEKKLHPHIYNFLIKE